MEEAINKVEEVVEEVADKAEDVTEKVEDKVEEAADKAKDIKDKAKEGVENMAKDAKKVVVVEDDNEGDGKLRFKLGLKQAAKYALTSLVCFGGGVATKTIYDNHKAKKAVASANSAPSEFVDAPYEAAPEQVTYSDGDTTITEF